MPRRPPAYGDVDFGRLLMELRRIRALTQELLARELEVTFATVNAWERGRHRPIRALASKLLEMAREAGIKPRLVRERHGRGARSRQRRHG